MPQIIGVWCKEEGHEVNYSIYTGSKKVIDLLDAESDIVFISSFTIAGQLAYAISNYFRSQDIVTVLGGPHARCFPEDSCQNFDYVLGLTDKELLKDLLANFEVNKPLGIYLTTEKQPSSIPGVRERWDFIKEVHRQARILKMVPMISSFGCPYNCDFCIDSEVPYQALDIEMIKKDLQFLMKKMKHPIISWYDPNFGIKFNPIMEAIESVVPPGAIFFIGETSLSMLNEPNVKRLKMNGFKIMMPGVESWYDYGNKSRTGFMNGMEKVRSVAEQLNMIQRHIPTVHANIILGQDTDEGEEPFALTKRFVDLAPGIYPSYALLSTFGKLSRNNLKYETEDRIIPFPFHMMRTAHILHIIPKNYTWEELYNHYIDLMKYSFSNRAIYRRFKANHMAASRWMSLLLSLSIGGQGKIRKLSAMINYLKENEDFRSFVTRTTDRAPDFMIQKVKKDLGIMWDWLPNKSLSYDFKLYSKYETAPNQAH